MDFYGSIPMPSLESRIADLLKLIENPLKFHVDLATKAAEETKDYSLMGYSMHGQADEKKRFLILIGTLSDI